MYVYTYVYNFIRRGKKYYYAPEYFITPQPSSLAVFKLDMWAMGIVFLLLSTGMYKYVCMVVSSFENITHNTI